MDLLSELLKILLTVSNTLLYPVLIALVILVFVALMMAGGFISEYSNRSKILEDKLEKGNLSEFNRKKRKIISKTKNKKMLNIELERLVQEYDLMFEKKLEKTRLLIRLGPILGLMGTLIPMGPALIGLSSGNINEMANQLMIAFTTTVVGLFIGGIALFLTTIRRRWYMEDIRDIEYLVEKIMTIGEKPKKEADK
jgi:biopolymer transport protein ExbB/TolQ